MLIGTHQSIVKIADVRIHINNEPLKHLSVAKFLGMYIDSNLKWDDQINNMILKISAKIGILRFLRKIVPNDTLRHLYNAIFQPHFDYGDVVYDSASITSKTRLQKLQFRAARLISGSSPLQIRNVIFKELGWLSLQQRRDFLKCVFMYKGMNGLAPQYLCDMFTSNSISCNTRNASHSKPPKARTAYYQRCFGVSCLKLWNSLPQDIQNSQSVASFKKSFRKYLSATPPF